MCAHKQYIRERVRESLLCCLVSYKVWREFLGFFARFLISIAQLAKLVAPRDTYMDLFDRYRNSMTSRDYRVHVWRFPRRSRHLGHRHAYVTSDEVKYTPYVSCTRHIDAYVHLAQNVQLTSNILKVFAYELRRKYVYRYVRN